MPRKSRIRRKNNRRRTIRRKKIGGGHDYTPYPFVAAEGVDLKGYKEIYVDNFNIYKEKDGEQIGSIHQHQIEGVYTVYEIPRSIATGLYTLEDYKKIKDNNYLIWIKINK